MELLKGKLTYLVAAATVVWAIAGLVLGTLDGQTATTLVLAGLGTFGIRRAIK